MNLFAVQPPAAVTVADIAAQAGMTPAAVYYHFPSKDEILLEGVRLFSADLVAEVRVLAHDLPVGDTPGGLLVRLLEWLEERSAASSVYFVSSMGASVEIETVRMQARAQLVTAFRRMLRRYSVSAAEGAVVATAMVATLETAAGSWLEQDTTFRGLGRRAFLGEVSAQVDRVAGVPGPAVTGNRRRAAEGGRAGGNGDGNGAVEAPAGESAPGSPDADAGD